jgi:hypothetical protein
VQTRVNDANMAPKLSIVPKLQKLILMLSSSRDGEVLAAAEAITKTLRANGLDWHDLARLLAKPPHQKPTMRDDYLDWQFMAAFCFDRGHLLNERDADFINQLHRSNGRPSDK